MATKKRTTVQKDSKKRDRSKDPVKTKIGLKIVDFNNTLNWGGSVPADFRRTGKFTQLRHRLEYRITLIRRNPSNSPSARYVSFYVEQDWDGEKVATEFLRAYGSGGDVPAVQVGSKIIFTIPSQYVAVVHTISSRNYGDGAIIPHEPVSNAGRLRILRSADELTYLEVWTTD